ncbi:S-adenosyl-L-methionine-dependent methyltransferase [Xylariaceae sp. FL0804]|nr:S-adenosyl-L-methionine-dependent methyltransferase [Xylariaceae sp. FL0804]
MFVVRSCVRNAFSPLIARLERRCLSTYHPPGRPAEPNIAEPSGRPLEPEASEHPGPSPRRGRPTAELNQARKADSSFRRPAAERKRVNIVSDGLCDDILSYIGPSLDRHQGCDLLDINPGVGLWSRKLHEYLSPRSHILMEPDAQFYQPFLEPLLERPGVTLLEKSGILWRDLAEIMTPEYLPHQKIANGPQEFERNDTLLVVANLAYHPPKRFKRFESLSAMVMYQFIKAIRYSALWNRYGLVRVLMWTRADESVGVLPQNIHTRKRLALDAELSCDWVHEVCGPNVHPGWFYRENDIGIHGAIETAKRMRLAKLDMPPGREPPRHIEALRLLDRGEDGPVPGRNPPTWSQPWQGLLDEMHEENQKVRFDQGSDQSHMMQKLKWRKAANDKRSEEWHNSLNRLGEIKQMLHEIRETTQNTPDPDDARQKTERESQKAEELQSQWVAELSSKSSSWTTQYVPYRDNLHAYNQSILMWDRRHYEPLAIRANEFAPNAECSLLDIQPKAPHPLLTETGPGTSQAADTFDLLVMSLMSEPNVPVRQHLDSFIPGSADYIMPRCESMRDLKPGTGITGAPRGFIEGLPWAEATPRQLTTDQWLELLELWMNWPFRPDFIELVGRSGEEVGGTGDSKDKDP